MQNKYLKHLFAFVALFAVTSVLGCGAVSGGGGIGDILNDNIDDVLNDNGTIDDVLNDNESTGTLVELSVYATNTGGATGIAVDLNGDLYAVNKDGLFGPISEGDDLSTMDPIGATNLADLEVFTQESVGLVLAITRSGEFWIGSDGSARLAVVPPEGGLAEPFIGQLTIEGMEQRAVKPETMAIVPDDFDGSRIHPGNLLLGQDSAFNHLAVIDVENERAVVLFDHPKEPDDLLNRQSHHLTFGLNGNLYGSRGQIASTEPGIQVINEEGEPRNLDDTVGVKADSFVALENGDLIIRGAFSEGAGDTVNGILIYSAEDREIVLALSLPNEELSERDEMIITPGGETIFLALPKRDEIVRAIDVRE